MTQTQDRTDTNLKAAIVAELAWTTGVNRTHIGVAVDQGAVSLSGEVETYPERRLAERAAMRVHGVTAIAEDITLHVRFGGLTLAQAAAETGLPEPTVRCCVIPDSCGGCSRPLLPRSWAG